MVSELVKYSLYPKIDLKYVYNQVTQRKVDWLYTAFEARGKWSNLKRMSFEISNGVAEFQNCLDDIIEKEGLNGTFIYTDDVTFCGTNEREHTKLARFKKQAEKYVLTLKESKCVNRATKTKLLGYEVSKRIMRPNSKRLGSLWELPPPDNVKS